MKKTLIALMALAGVAAAGTSTITLNNSSSLNAVIVTAELSLDQLTRILWTKSTNTAMIGFQDSGDNKYAAIVGTWNGKQEVFNIIGKNAGEGVNGTPRYYWNPNIKVDDYFSQTDALKGAITLAYAGSNVDSTNTDNEGVSVLISVQYADASVVHLYGNDSALKWSNNYISSVTYADNLMDEPTVTVTSTPWSAASLKEMHEGILGIPEPTTATLSLLALAGLAARRRRKLA